MPCWLDFPRLETSTLVYNVSRLTLIFMIFPQGIMGERYSSTEVVLVAELMKVVASAYLTVVDKQEGKSRYHLNGRFFSCC